MANPVTIDDVEDRWRSLTPGEATQAQALLDFAWAVVVASVASVEDRLDDETLSRDLVVGVVVTAVLRVLKNPEGYRSETNTEGDSTWSFTREDGNASGRLFFEPGELALLEVNTEPVGAFTITPYGAPAGGSTEPQLWL